MRYLSVCSGIEAASVAWKPLGWECVGVSEIDKFPRAVLQHRLGAVPVDDDHRWQPGQNFTPLFGDFTQIEAHHVGPVDLLVGGTPCQSFSIAGKRLGLDDPRGNLTLEFFALAERVRPSWIVWENVPGVLSHDDGRTFGTVLGLMGECGFRWAYRVLDAQYVRVGRFPRAVPQRRRRVFLVGYSGTADIHPRAVLFDRESLRGNPAPRRETGQSVAPTIAPRTRGGGGLGTDFDCDGGLIAGQHGPAISPAMKARDSKGPSSDGDGDGDGLPLISVAHALRGEGFDASEDGTGRGTPIVPVQHEVMSFKPGQSEAAGGTFVTHGYAPTLQAANNGSTAVPAVAVPVQHTREVAGALTANYGKQPDSSDTGLGPNLIAFTAKDHGGDAVEGISPTLRAGGHTGSHANAGVMPAIAFAHQAGGKQTTLGAVDDGTCQTLGAHQTPAIAFKPGSSADARSIGAQEEVGCTLEGGGGGNNRQAIAAAWGVRRLTPTECERLQGFPDGYTAIPWGKKTAEECPDGPRYKALGNSMAVNCMIFLGERIQAVMEAINAEGA